ncbi:MAG: hypothetical protein ACOX9R_10500 [Armatimonadota bacterium]|jgi:DNA-directed RNA polymerase specialized sigma subunit
MMARIAVRWPEDIDGAWVRSHATASLQRIAASVEDEEALPIAAVQAISERLRTLLGGTQWYREAVLGRARPLCEAWRGAILAGREPTDHTLSSRLRLSRDELVGRFVELATVFALEPAALLPEGVELSEGVAVASHGLPCEQRLAISLYFEQHLTFAEIAQVMEVLPVRAQELIGRAVAAIAGEVALEQWPISRQPPAAENR